MQRTFRLAKIVRIFSRYRLDTFFNDQPLPANLRFLVRLTRLRPTPKQPRGERLRMALPPHNGDERLRLACQVNVLGDIDVTKYKGLFGGGDAEATGPSETGGSRR